MDPLCSKIILENEEATQCLVDRPSCLIDDSLLKTVALEDERFSSEEPQYNTQYLLGGVGSGYRPTATRSLSQGPSNLSKFQIFWDKTYFATAVGALRLSIMGSMVFAILLLSFFKSDSCHSSPPIDHSSTTTHATTIPESGPSAVFGFHLLVCFITLTAMIAWIAIDNSSFNYRFPFKWKLFDCCVYCALILLSLVSISALVGARKQLAKDDACRDSIGKLDMAIAFSFLAVVIILTLITIRFFDKEETQLSRSNTNPMNWIRRFSKSKQNQILLQPVA